MAMGSLRFGPRQWDLETNEDITTIAYLKCVVCLTKEYDEIIPLRDIKDIE